MAIHHHSETSAFRFAARISSNGDVVWDKQPTPEEMEADYDAFIQAHGGTFPPQFPRFPGK